MSRRVVAFLWTLGLLAVAARADLRLLSVRVTDLDDRPVQGLSLTLENSSPGVTNEFGVARLELDSSMPPGTQVSLYLSTQDGTEKTWFLISPWAGQGWYLPAPGEGHSPIKVDVKGRDGLLENDLFLQQVVQVGADRLMQQCRPAGSTQDPRLAVLRELASQAGLEASEVEAALRAWANRKPGLLDEGMAALTIGSYAEAENSFEQALRETEEQRAKVLKCLGYSRYYQGKHSEALGAYREAIKIRPDDLEIVNGMGIAYLESGDSLAARELYEHHLGPDTPSPGQALCARHNLAIALSRQGNFKEAQSVLDQVLTARRQDLGHEHIDTLQTLANLGLVLLETGETERSVDIQGYVERNLSEQLGHASKLALQARHNLAVALTKSGRLDEARPFTEDVLTHMREQFGWLSPEAIASEVTLLSIEFQEGNLKVAERMLSNLICFAESSPLPPNHQESFLEFLATIEKEYPETYSSAVDVSRSLFPNSCLPTSS